MPLGDGVGVGVGTGVGVGVGVPGAVTPTAVLWVNNHADRSNRPVCQIGHSDPGIVVPACASNETSKAAAVRALFKIPPVWSVCSAAPLASALVQPASRRRWWVIFCPSVFKPGAESLVIVHRNRSGQRLFVVGHATKRVWRVGFSWCILGTVLRSAASGCPRTLSIWRWLSFLVAPVLRREGSANIRSSPRRDIRPAGSSPQAITGWFGDRSFLHHTEYSAFRSLLPRYFSCAISRCLCSIFRLRIPASRNQRNPCTIPSTRSS